MRSFPPSLPLPPLPPRTARQARVAGHFGELVQGRLGPDGPVALITLPCPALTVQATWRPGPGFGLWQGGRPVGAVDLDDSGLDRRAIHVAHLAERAEEST